MLEFFDRREKTQLSKKSLETRNGNTNGEKPKTLKSTSRTTNWSSSTSSSWEATTTTSSWETTTTRPRRQAAAYSCVTFVFRSSVVTPSWHDAFFANSTEPTLRRRLALPYIVILTRHNPIRLSGCGRALGPSTRLLDSSAGRTSSCKGFFVCSFDFSRPCRIIFECILARGLSTLALRQRFAKAQIGGTRLPSKPAREDDVYRCCAEVFTSHSHRGPDACPVGRTLHEEGQDEAQEETRRRGR